MNIKVINHSFQVLEIMYYFADYKREKQIKKIVKRIKSFVLQVAK